MEKTTEKELNAQFKFLSPEGILRQKNKTDDVKLFEIFQIYKDELKKDYTALYYALLGWKDSHLKELLSEQNKNN